MQKKLLKLLKIGKERLMNDTFGKHGRNILNRVLFYKQLRLKNYYHFSKSILHRKPFERAITAVARSLDKPAQSRFGQLPLMTNFWKDFLPRVHKGHKERTVWVRSAGKTNIPKLSRGFKVSQICNSSNSREMFQKLFEQVNGEAEQQFYTEGTSLTDVFSRKEKQQIKDVPPPQRCRLSCPLPPEKFIPPSDNNFFSSYQSPSLRFSSLPSEFLPSHKEKPTEESTSMKMKEHKYAKKNVYTYNVDLPDFLPQSSVKNKKNYRKLQNVKSLLEGPSREIPKMKALLFQPENLALNFDSVNVPTKIFKDEVLVQVIYSGVCGMDMFITEGKVSCGTNPIILGHEISGKVYATGSDVKHVNIGDYVAVNAYTGCFVCRYCSRGLYSSCLKEGINNSIGLTKNGGWAEFIVVKKSQVFKIPEQMGLDQAALIQPLSCVLSALTKLNITYGMDVLILGLGVSGLLWASVLHSKGFTKVFVSDKNPKRNEKIENLGLNYTFIPVEDVGKYFMDVIIECTGSPTTIEKAFNILNPNGQMCFFGKPNPMSEVRCIPYEIIRKEITLLGNSGNSFCFSKAVDLAASLGDQYLEFEKLGVEVFNLEDYKEAFQLKKLGEVNKIMFKLDS